jgi:syntaxin-binding protein 1
VDDLGLSDELFDDLDRRLKTTGAKSLILSLKELYVDFMGNKKKF